MLPQISIDASVATVLVKKRGGGGITGSRTAGAMGRIPVEVTAARKRESIAQSGFDVGVGMPLGGSSYVDNLFCYSHCVGGALRLADDFEAELKQTWGSLAKPGSRLCLPVAQSIEAEVLPLLAARWPD